MVAWNLNWDPKTCTGNREISFFLKKEKNTFKEKLYAFKKIIGLLCLISC